MNQLNNLNIHSLEEIVSGFQNGIGKGKSFYGSGVKVANIGDLYKTPTFSPIKYSLLECNQKEIEKYRLNRGDLLFVRSSLKREGVAYCSAYESDETCLFSSFMIRVSSDQSKVFSPFLSYQLRSPRGRAELLARSNTSTITNISQDGLKSVQVWLPPLETQRRIVGLLDRAQGLIDKRKKQITLMDTLTQSLFYTMFGDPVTNPMGWGKSEFGNHIESILGGTSVGGNVQELKNGEYAVLKISAVTSGAFLASEYKVVQESDLPDEFIHPRMGDLLFSRANTRELVGAVCIVDSDYTNLFLPDKLWKIKLRENSLTTYFVKFLLSHDGFRESLRKVATGTSGSMLNISKAKLKKIIVLTPPLALQTQFADRVQKIEAQKEAMTASLKELENNFNSLMQRAFKGEL